MNDAEIESCKNSIRLMQHALNNEIEEEDKRNFDVLDVARYFPSRTDNPASNTIFRSRMISQERLSKMEGTVSINEFRYPPKSAAVENKCNVYGQPVAYCSSDFLGAVIETIFSKGPELRPGYHFFVSEWINENSSLKVFNTNKRLSNNDNPLPNERDIINSYLETLEKCFTHPEGYFFSSQFSQEILFGSPDGKVSDKYEVIEYPCNPHPKGGRILESTESWNNYAIVPSVFDKYQFRRVFLIETPKMNELIQKGTSAFHFLLVGYEDPDYPGIVRWKRPVQNDLPEITSQSTESPLTRLFNIDPGDGGKN